MDFFANVYFALRYFGAHYFGAGGAVAQGTVLHCFAHVRYAAGISTRVVIVQSALDRDRYSVAVQVKIVA